MNNYQNSAGHAEAQQPGHHANLFLFDLKNEAREHGFRTGDSWILQLVTDEEMVSLKRHHHPLISIKLYPDVLLGVFQQVKQKLNQTLNKEEEVLTVTDMMNNHVKYLAAYPDRKPR